MGFKGMKWIKVEDEMPEDSQSRIIKGDGLNPEKSVKVLVYTEEGSIINNQRIKMAVGEEEWTWFMNIECETITHWCRYLSPVKDDPLI